MRSGWTWRPAVLAAAGAVAGVVLSEPAQMAPHAIIGGLFGLGAAVVSFGLADAFGGSSPAMDMAAQEADDLAAYLAECGEVLDVFRGRECLSKADQGGRFCTEISERNGECAICAIAMVNEILDEAGLEEEVDPEACGCECEAGSRP